MMRAMGATAKLLGHITGVAAAGTLLLGLFPATAHSQLLATGTDGSGRSASALFEVSGSDLLVTLTNTATADAMAPTDVLTAIFFEYDSPIITPDMATSSVTLAPGSTVIHGGTTDPGDSVGGEWAFQSGTNFFSTYDYGISSSGLNLFGPGDRFPGNNLFGPDSPDGIQYGLTTAGDDPSTGNGGITDPLIKNAVVINLKNMGTLDLNSIGTIRFQYGTAAGVGGGTSEPHIETHTLVRVPEPGTLALLALGGSALAGLAARRRRPS